MYPSERQKIKKIGRLRACARFKVSLGFCVYGLNLDGVTLNLKVLVLPSVHLAPTW